MRHISGDAFWEILAAIAIQLVLILIAVKAAKGRRSKCNWTSAMAGKRTVFSIVGIVISQVLPILGPAQPGSPLAILCLALELYSIYVLARAFYRRADLQKLALK